MMEYRFRVSTENGVFVLDGDRIDPICECKQISDALMISNALNAALKPKTIKLESMSLLVLEKMISHLEKSERGMTIVELAAKVQMTDRRMRDYVHYLHDNRTIYIASYENAGRGKKVSRYLIRKNEETDAKKWWIK